MGSTPEHTILDHFSRQEQPSSGVLRSLIQCFRNPYFATALSIGSAAAVATQAYPESRSSEQNTIAGQIADRSEFTAKSLLPILGGDTSPKTPKEQLWLLLGAFGFWVANAGALSNLLRDKVKQIEGDDVWKPQDVVESKFLFSADRLPDEDTLELLLEREGFSKMEITQAYCPSQNGVEMKLQHCDQHDGTSITRLKGKRSVPTMEKSNRRSEVYETVIADKQYSALFFEQVMLPAMHKGVFGTTSNKVRWTRHDEKTGVSIHIDSYGRDEEGKQRLFMEVVQSEQDKRDSLEVAPDFLRGFVVGKTRRGAGQRIQDQSYEQLIELAVVHEMERIKILLGYHGISHESWTHDEGNKTIRDLATEVIKGEAHLETDAESGEMYRRVPVINLHVYAYADGKKKKIVEKKQVRDGQVISENRHDFLSEKLLPAETVEKASVRALQEEAGLEAKTTIFSDQNMMEKREDSHSYPGLKSHYQIHQASITLLPEQYCQEGYTEKKSDGREIHYAWDDCE